MRKEARAVDVGENRAVSAEEGEVGGLGRGTCCQGCGSLAAVGVEEAL